MAFCNIANGTQNAAAAITTPAKAKAKPRLGVPSLPRPEHVVSVACPGDPNQGATRANDHDLVNLVTSGYLDRLGFDYRPASPASTFREPSKILQAYRLPGT